jgi:hypothetical protein
VFRVFADLFTILPTYDSPSWFLVALALGGVVFTALGLAFSTFLGWLGARVGAWLARRSGRSKGAVGA